MTLVPEQARRLLREAAGPTADAPAPSPLDHLLPVSVGPYLARRLIGVGGMGSVYEATQPSLERPVALKLIPPYSLSRRAVDRFHFEATILSRLRHPNIATIFDAGTAHIDALSGEWPYYAMEFIDDAKPIDAFARDNDLSIDDRIRLLIDVADAVHHAHQRAIIHRDIKPDNVLVGADAVPKVIDFGIAASLQTDPDSTLAQTFHTQSHQILGSFQFMAPEQFDSPDVDVRADVYALGLILYLLLTDAMPYDVSRLTPAAAASRIRSTPIKPPAAVRRAPAPIPRRRRLHRDLNAITLKALAYSPAKRYDSAADLAKDLRAHLRGNPISARPPSRWQRAAAWIGRHPFAATVASCLCLIAITLTAVLATFMALRWFSLQPHSVAIDDQTREVTVMSRAGLVTSSRPASELWTAMHAVRVAQPLDWVVVIADFAPTLQHSRVSAFSPNNLRSPLWTLDLDRPGFLTPPHQSFSTPAPGDHWGITRCQSANVFPDIPGDEVILIVNHTPSFPSALVILSSSDGRVVHVAWHTGHIGRVAWCPANHLLTVAGADNRLPWTDLGAPPTTNPAIHPAVVFAYTPTQEQWNDTWLASPTEATHSTAWYAACADPITVNRFRHFSLSPVGGSRLSGMPLKFQLAAFFQHDSFQTLIGPGWRIGPEGPIDTNPEISSELRESPYLSDADDARLILLTDHHPIGDRNWRAEMSGPP